MCEVSIVVMDYWFNMLNKFVLCVLKVVVNSCFCCILDSSGMWFIRMEKKVYVSGMFDFELWEIIWDEWNVC